MENLLTEAKLNFELKDKIGKGGEGDVYQALDYQLDAILAVKKVAISKFTDESKYFEESKKLYITKHQNIVKVNYGCRTDDHIFLAMPFYSNGSLKNLTDSRYLTTREIIRYSLQFLSGLNHIHTKGLLHFDVKLENILLSKSNQALISDFGLAQYTGNYGFATVFGTTPIYAPPELFSQPKHNIKYDIYQAGITLYRMCNGDEDFSNQIQSALVSKGVKDDNNFINAVQKGNFPDRRKFLPHIPKGLIKVIKKAINPVIDKRYNTIIDMMNDIAGISEINEWQYSVSGNDEAWCWGDCVLTCHEGNGIISVSSRKNGRRKTSFCEEKLTTSQKYSFIYKALMSNW